MTAVDADQTGPEAPTGPAADRGSGGPAGEAAPAAAQEAATARAARAAEVLAGLTGAPRHDVAVVLGSGWVTAADALGEPAAEFAVSELPGFATPRVVGHGARARSVVVAGRRVLVFTGRTHVYEGHGTDAVVHPVRVATAAGCRAVVLTNAAGGLREGLRVGEPVLIRDHVNLTGRSPLVGARFVDMTDAYSARLRSLVTAVDGTLTEGVYAMLPGPQFETPAEIAMLRVLGADLVGMSTALETIAARAEGAEVLGISLVTNLAAGIAAGPLDHAEVLATGRAAAARVGGLLARVVAEL